jgi:hypothetical protein
VRSPFGLCTAYTLSRMQYPLSNAISERALQI